MEPTPTAQPDTNALLQALLQRLTPQPAPSVTSPFAPRPSAGPPQPVGLLVPVTLDTQAGQVRCYAQFGADVASNPQVLVDTLLAAGWPIAAWNSDKGSWQGRRPFRRFP
jgi:hypothetical protein